MLNISNYQLIEKIYESANSLVYRGILLPDKQPIILKILKESYPTPSELIRYKQEYEITTSLNVENIVKAYELQRYKNSLVMLLEDFGGQSLNLLITKHQFSLEEFLTVAIKITESLAVIHAANIIHKDLNPANIVYNRETGKLKIIDFGISTQLSQENQSICNINQLEGTLAYIAPEQTGRMNRGIDYRSDFYSLGVTFYELLTYQLPFATNDPIELVHCHIAQHPKAPHELISSIPLTISNIVMKLLAKTPEERYQSASGIKADLAACLQQLKTLGKISQFPLASQDISEKFYIPQKLYGREQEISQLLTTFERVSQGTTEMILVSGYSGIGKSALVNEIHKPITGQHGYFIHGKFDQFQRNIPYAAIAQAFKNLISQLLSEPEIALQTWREKILATLGTNGQIIIDVIPDLEKIIGKQLPVEQLGATEAQNRFNLYFKRFIDIFSRKEHPLVIFLDDLQWADLPSLNLIKLLMANFNSQYLLIIGAYRDNEVSLTHPLTHTLEQIKKVEAKVNHIMLQPLGIHDVNELIADTLNCSIKSTKPLAELVVKKTEGNSFFINQLLQNLYKEKLLTFKHSRSFVAKEESKAGNWHWDIAQLYRIGITDNVVELMVKKIEKLDENTQEILKIAACIGSQFNLEILSIVNNESLTLISQKLQPAVKEGLIIPLSNDYKIPMLWSEEEILATSSALSSAFSIKYPESIPYKFLHDRIQQAAYSLIPEIERKNTHLKIGKLLLKNTTPEQQKDNIFALVNQLNFGIDLLSNQIEKDELAHLNLIAGQKAKISTAYETAVNYLLTGTQLLSSSSWRDRYDLTLNLYIELTESQYLCTNFDLANEYAEIVLQNASNLLDRVKIMQIKMQMYLSQLKLQETIDTGIQALELLEINIEEPPPNLPTIEELFLLPEMTDPGKIAAIQILINLSTAAFFADLALLPKVISTLINISSKYGNASLSALAYILHGMILCCDGSDIDAGYRFGQLGLKLLDKFNATQFKCKTLNNFYAGIAQWKKPLSSTLEHLQLGIQVGLETGDLDYGSYCAYNYCAHNFFIGENLQLVKDKLEHHIRLTQKFKHEWAVNSLNLLLQAVLNLEKNECLLIEVPLNENEIIATFEQANNFIGLALFYLFKTLFAYVFGQTQSAVKYASMADKYVANLMGMISYGEHYFYYSLALLADYSYLESNEQKQYLALASSHQEKMQKWAYHAPENFKHKYDLVEAEKAQILGQYWQAEEFYEQAIQGARKYEFLQEEAMAYERAAYFYLSIDREEIGQLYLRNAYHCYARWGAKAKVKQLEEKYPQHFIGTTNLEKAKSFSPTISTTTNDGKILDLTTVIKSSQALAGEIVLSKLLAKLMKITIENAGAQKGFLVLSSHDNWVIEAQATVDSDDINILQSLPLSSVDASTQLPLLSTGIINYVARTQENVVLNNAVYEEQFIHDPYIIATQPKSILCTPLLNQGKLSGILYLENNLTTDAFTSERIEFLRILSAQAAISIENSRLYEQLENYNRTLEQKVNERTQELSQTLEVLKATQAELIFENQLLRSDESPSFFDYQVGGSLPMDAPTYVVRSADRYLYKALKRDQFCYILNSRQMGKSSLVIRMMHHLQGEGVSCAAIDMTLIGSENITPEQWYKGLAVELWRSFGLAEKVNFKAWWQEQLTLSPVHRLGRFIEEVLLAEAGVEDNTSPKKLVIFLDEIDSVLGINFPVNDFFALIRFCYNQRSINRNYQRLTFVLIGVATPANLMTDARRTPFNIGQSIHLEGFKEHEAQPLLQGLAEKVNNPQMVLKEVLAWTNGQPFLTQKLCNLIRNSSSPIPNNSEANWIENLVRKHVIEHWESQDEPEHLRTIRDRILKSEQQPLQLLKLYQQICHSGEVVAVDSLQERELLLSGLVIKQDGFLKVHNPIYKLIFDSNWVEQHIIALGS